MKKIVAYCLFTLMLSSQAFCGYYLRGTIRDAKSNPLSSARIFIFSTGFSYASGNDGSFGIPTPVLYDSIVVSMDGFETKRLKVKTDVWQNIVLEISSAIAVKNRPKLISVTKDRQQDSRYNILAGDETYFKLVENDAVNSADYPNTGFSLNVNKASYSNVRRFLNMNSRVPPDAVRIEELINYFGLGYVPPPPGKLFGINTNITPCPWNKNDNLLFVNINAQKIDISNIPPGNFVFLIDVSGSMDMPNRLPLLKAAFHLFVNNLRPQDKVSIVIYGGTVGVWLPPTPGDEKEKINRAIEVMVAAGDTPGASAIQEAYKVAKSSFIAGGNNRVILATDGDFNVGQITEKALDELITKERQSGVYLTCLGVGMGNLKDSKLQTLAKRGNGNYAYLDNIQEAEKVLVHELTETLYTVAENVYLNIHFDPAMVSSYRLLGFDNRKDVLLDKKSELEGGEIGSGSSTTAIFEIELSKDFRSDAIAVLDVHYEDKDDSTGLLRNINYPVPAKLSDTMNSIEHFQASVAMFGMKLKDSKYLNSAGWDLISREAKLGADTNFYIQNDFLMLLEKAREIYSPRKRKLRDKIF